MGNTKREIELQELAMEALKNIEPHILKHIPSLNNSMEMIYYFNNLMVRMEIILSIRFGLKE